jgi:16S rRNA (guanine1207-N2)-methyltransferase
VIHASIGGVALRFETAEALFSPRGVDAGTLAMLSRAVIETGDKVLDLGCGYGCVGVYAAKLTAPERVWLVDSDPLAVEYARRNLRLNGIDGPTVVLSDGLRNLEETGFNKFLCNPPYHADFSVPKHLIEKGFNRLVLGGALWMVTRREAWYRNKLDGIFGGVRVHAADGYFVFEARKKSLTYAAPAKSGADRKRGG